jgi:hypothetical protein
MSIRSSKFLARTCTVLAAAVLAGFALAPSAAQAASSGTAFWKDPDSIYNGGRAESSSSGENLALLDFRADGWGTRAQLQVKTLDPAGYWYWKNTGPVCFDDTNTSNSAGGMTVCDSNVAENATYRIHIWASSSGTYKWHNYSGEITA